MFFIAGIQPKTVTIDDGPRICPACGLARARLKRVDHYLSLFFIPLFPVRKGTPFVHCEGCGGGPGGEGHLCARCGRALEGRFRFCPHCGAEQ